ncbi:MAG: signal recognition particle-docking protein FtsY [Spirochaetes bacterium GWF1_41_5]|nr:MAG: signal recognition particle-docking protein FtsY [Spirochaetes bacterium GWF1_41_5]
MPFFSKNRNRPSEDKSTGFSWKKLFFRASFESFMDEAGQNLLAADAGPEAAAAILEQLKFRIKEQKLRDVPAALLGLQNIIAGMFPGELAVPVKGHPEVWIVLGVNGAGKTSSIAKLGNFFQSRGLSVIFGAADTFRAAATEQLAIWGERLNIPVIKQQEGADPASVVFDSVQSALARNIDLTIIDTAGRLQNKDHLMQQLEKICRISDRFSDRMTRRNLLVLDATIGQNNIEQAKIFRERVGVHGILLTKTDTLARGGTLLSISQAFNLPVWFTACGEKTGDLKIFSGREYAESLISG